MHDLPQRRADTRRIRKCADFKDSVGMLPQRIEIRRVDARGSFLSQIVVLRVGSYSHDFHLLRISRVDILDFLADGIRFAKKAFRELLVYDRCARPITAVLDSDFSPKQYRNPYRREISGADMIHTRI